MKLADAIERYLIVNYHLSDRTKQIYREHLTRLCQYLANPPLAEIDMFSTSSFMNSLRCRNGKTYSPGYKDQIYRTINTFFNFCLHVNWLPANPMVGIKRPRITNGPKPRLSLCQIQQLLDAVGCTEAKERNLAMILLMVDCGLRLGEVVSLTLGDVFLDEQHLSVHDAKNDTRRDVPLSEMAGLALTTYLKKRAPTTITNAVFLRVKGAHRGDAISIKAVEELMKRLKRKLQFPLHAHLLRHTFGNHYIRIGGLRYLQKILGHSRIDTTARFYTDPDFPDIQREHRRAAPTAQIDQKNKIE